MKQLPQNLLANSFLICGFIILTIGLNLIFSEFKKAKVNSQAEITAPHATSSANPEDSCYINYQSHNLSDEELAGAIATPLNQKTGTVDQELGTIDYARSQTLSPSCQLRLHQLE